MDRDPLSRPRIADDAASLDRPNLAPRKFGRLPARAAAHADVLRPAPPVLPAPSDPSRRVMPIEAPASSDTSAAAVPVLPAPSDPSRRVGPIASAARSDESPPNLSATAATSEDILASPPHASAATPDSFSDATPGETAQELVPYAMALEIALHIDTPAAPMATPMAASLESTAPDIVLAEAPELPIVPLALQSAEPAPAYDPPPLALPATLELDRAAPPPRRRPVGRAVKWICAFVAMFFLGLAGARAVAAYTAGLPPCESETAASLVAAMAREKAAELKLPFTTLGLAGARTVAHNDGAAQCAGAIHIDGQAALRIRYEISWTHRLLARFEVRIIETVPQ